MERLELKVIESFRRCKNDIIKLHKEVADLSQGQERIMEHVDDLRKKLVAFSDKFSKIKAVKPVVRTVVRKVPSKPKVIVKRIAAPRARKRFVASKTGKDVHDQHCPFARNIKPKSRVFFNSKTKALNAGYKLCECLKKV